MIDGRNDGFSALLGNSSLKVDLKHTIHKDKQTHAYLIEGASGSGKKTLANILAKAFLCSDAQNKPCGICNNCSKAEKGIHPDISVIGRAENKETISIDAVRELKESAYILPNEAEKKIFIIQSADKLTPQAQNALLKLLEEPPRHTVFILLCENINSILQTILSRVVILTLSPVSFNESETYFRENYKIGDKKIRNILSASGGYIGGAIKFLKSGVDEKQKKLCIDFLNNLLCNSEYKFILYINKLGGSKENLVDFLQILNNCLSDIVKFKISGESMGSFLSTDELAQFSKLFATKQILNLIEIVSNTKISIENTNANKTICIASMFSKCWEEVH